ncbi:MAG: hypothetical protein ACREV6_02085 [Clostridium sp.]|uniref:hypothetical protein n=1 Tax=Clostridium sp. TaxID=1506 RepID=UPI003D6D6B5A
MEVLKVLNKLEILFQELEIQYNDYLKRGTTIDDLIKKLLMVIENDNFNSAEAYNYCKILKELLIKKRKIDDLKFKYEKILSIYTSKIIRTNIDRKMNDIRSKKYTSRFFHNEEEISKYLNES